jgi:PAS domain S-box-containing protein
MEFYPEKLRKIRKQKRFTVKRFCELVGVSRATLWGWESGKRTPSLTVTNQLAKVLDVSSNEFTNIADKNTNLGNELKESFELEDIIGDHLSEDSRSRIKLMRESLDIITERLLKFKVITYAFMNSTDAICYVKDLNYKYISVNKAFLEHLSLPLNFAAIGKTDFDFFSIKESTMNSSMDLKVLHDGKSIVNFEGSIPGSRNKKHGLISKFPILDAHNRVLGLLCIITDITESKRQGVVKDMLEKITNSVETGSIIYNPKQDKIHFASVAIQKIFSVSLEEINRIGLTSFIKKVYATKYYNAFLERKKNNVWMGEWIIQTKKGAWIQARSVKFKYMNTTCYAIYYKDISKQKRINDISEIIKQSIDDIGECFCILDTTKRQLVYLNEYREKLYGYPAKNFINIENNEFWLNNCVHPDDRSRLQIYENKREWPLVREFRIIRPDGEIRWIRATKIGRKFKYDGNLAYAFVDKDITEEKKHKQLFQLFAESLNFINDGIIITDSEGNCVFINETIAKKLKYSQSSFLENKNFFEKIKIVSDKREEYSKINDEELYSVKAGDNIEFKVKERQKEVFFSDISYTIKYLSFF